VFEGGWTVDKSAEPHRAIFYLTSSRPPGLSASHHPPLTTGRALPKASVCPPATINNQPLLHLIQTTTYHAHCHQFSAMQGA
jgi:hypothetical protein